MKSTLLNLALAATVSVLAACGGGSGGGSTSTGGVYYTHEQLAQEFVRRAYTDAGVKMTLMKTNTLEYGFIVVEEYGQYKAYSIEHYNVGENIRNFLINTQSYDGLDYIGSNQYKDFWTGLVFEETSASSKDLEMLAAVKEELNIDASAANLQANLGLSEERSVEVARLASQLSHSPKSSMTNKDYDMFAKELMGSSITQLKAAQNSKPAMDALISKAAKVNEVSNEHMKGIISELFKM